MQFSNLKTILKFKDKAQLRFCLFLIFKEMIQVTMTIYVLSTEPLICDCKRRPWTSSEAKGSQDPSLRNSRTSELRQSHLRKFLQVGPD